MYTTCSNIILLVLYDQCIYVFHIILTIHGDWSLKRRAIGYCDVETENSSSAPLPSAWRNTVLQTTAVQSDIRITVSFYCQVNSHIY
jgi:hypothetical protein